MVAGGRVPAPRYRLLILRSTLLLLLLCLAGAVPAAGLRIVDLTHRLQAGMALWPGGEGFRKERVVDYDQGYRVHRFEMGENVGTHVDAPSHFIEGGASIDAITPAQLVSELVMIDVSAKASADPDYAATAADVEAFEAKHGRIPPGAFVALRTGWSERFSDGARYANQDKAGVMHFPGWSAEAADLLIERGVVGVGVDTLSTDPGRSRDFAVHHRVLGAGLFQVENLAHVEALPPRGATIVIGVLPVAEGSQAPARIFALVPIPAK